MPPSANASEWISQLRRGALELCILCLLRTDASYGYEIVTKLAELGPLAAGENTVYPLLRRLKGDGQLETYSVDSPSGPPRQYYRLTAQGRRRLQTLEKEWAELARAIDAVVSKGDTP